MNCVFYICIVYFVTSAQSLRMRRPRWKMGPDLASSAEMADNFAKPKTRAAIDMDYFGGSFERMRSQRSSDERSDERPQMNDDRSNPVILYINNPKGLEYQRKLIKDRSLRGSSSEGDDRVTYEDLMNFLLQVGARLKEQQGDNQVQHSNLLDVLRNTRKRTDDEIYESDKLDEPTKPLRLGKFEKDSIEKFKRKKNKLSSMEDVYKSPRNKRISIEELRGNRKRKNSGEDFVPNKFGMGGRMPKIPDPGQRARFIRTPKPYIGKQGIYEDK